MNVKLMLTRCNDDSFIFSKFWRVALKLKTCVKECNTEGSVTSSQWSFIDHLVNRYHMTGSEAEDTSTISSLKSS